MTLNRTITITPTRSISVGCDEESFSFPEELRLVALYENEDEDEDADAKGASVAFGPFGRRTLFATTEGLSSPRSMLKHSCKSLRPCTSGVLVLSHTDFTDYTEDSCLAGNINLTQTSQNSRNNISEQDNQRELDTITQNTHCFARVGHPDGDSNH